MRSTRALTNQARHTTTTAPGYQTLFKNGETACYSMGNLHTGVWGLLGTPALLPSRSPVRARPTAPLRPRHTTCPTRPIPRRVSRPRGAGSVGDSVGEDTGAHMLTRTHAVTHAHMLTRTHAVACLPAPHPVPCPAAACARHPPRATARAVETKTRTRRKRASS